eukprot:GILK01025048.1.p1 GENE.GILK01025048.1~~GILK01025048.1.p1  ORF type:complete len:166 (+),score=11.56 GILK01025048.1:93-590(+)
MHTPSMISCKSALMDFLRFRIVETRYSDRRSYERRQIFDTVQGAIRNANMLMNTQKTSKTISTMSTMDLKNWTTAAVRKLLLLAPQTLVTIFGTRQNARQDRQVKTRAMASNMRHTDAPNTFKRHKGCWIDSVQTRTSDGSGSISVISGHLSMIFVQSQHDLSVN